MDVIDIYRIFYSVNKEYALSAAHRTFSKIYHVIGHKASLTNTEN
jgi:hypothetical protein